VLGSSGPKGPPYIPFLSPNFTTPYLLKYPALPKQGEPDLQISLGELPEPSPSFKNILLIIRVPGKK